MDINTTVASKAQLAMMRDIKCTVAREISKHGLDGGWIEIGEVVMDRAYDMRAGGLSWRNADRTIGAIDRRGWLEHHPNADDLIRLSESGIRVLEAQR